MKSNLWLPAVCLFTVVGCGGSGGSSAPASPFAGTWNGTYVIPSLTQNGTANLTIASDGRISGTGRNITSGFNFNVSGTISNAGVISGTISGGTSGTLSGTLAISSTGRLTGNLVQTPTGGSGIASTFDLGRV